MHRKQPIDLRGDDAQRLLCNMRSARPGGRHDCLRNTALTSGGLLGQLGEEQATVAAAVLDAIKAARKGYPAFATIPDWCAMSGMGRSTTYEAIGAGHLRARKLGARTLIDVVHGMAWLDTLPAADICPARARNAA